MLHDGFFVTDEYAKGKATLCGNANT